MAPNTATVAAKVSPVKPLTSSPAKISPMAIGAPPPRGVGTVCDDRRPGTSIAAARCSNGMVTGSAAITKAPHDPAASTVVKSPGTHRMLAVTVTSGSQIVTMGG